MPAIEMTESHGENTKSFSVLKIKNNMRFGLQIKKKISFKSRCHNVLFPTGSPMDASLRYITHLYTIYSSLHFVLIL